MKLLHRSQSDKHAPQLPARSSTVTILRASGERIHARVAERDGDSLLVLVMFRTEQPLGGSALDDLVLEYASARGRVRLRGTVTLQDRDLLRFHDLRAVEVLQEREYVRVKVARPVTISTASSPTPVPTYTVDVSGGGLLLAGPTTLRVGERIEFRLMTTPGGAPICGSATVVRTDTHGHRAVCFDSIGEGDHRRLVRFVFECQRTERRRGLERGERRG